MTPDAVALASMVLLIFSMGFFLLSSDPKLAVLIVGHTDNQGAYDYNLDLSRRRAESVVAALAASYRADPKRLRAAGVGMLAPAASNDADDGRAKNRRVEVVKLN